ncbi:MAG: patatin family protein [Thomasclavelia sp.]|nr:patatin family protein [Thomasclavelia sp.]
MKTGIIDVGGGLRGIYAVGVFDYLMDQGITFDLGIGISAGSANVASYIAGQKHRNYRFYTRYSFNKEYMSLENFLKTKNYIGYDYIYSDLSNSDGKDPLDYNQIIKSKTDFRVIATNAFTGQPRYFNKDDIKQDDYDIFKASCCLPGVSTPYEINGIPYFDGALSDCVPIKKAFEEGCDKVVLVLTKPKDVLRDSKKDDVISKMISKEYPIAAKGLKDRAKTYNHGVKLAKRLEEEGHCLIIAPDDTCGVDTLKRSKESLIELYKKGYEDAKQIKDFIK